MRSHFDLPTDHDLTVTHFSEGAFNQLYAVAISDSGGNPCFPECVFRVTLPVEPFYKTASEVATLSYLRKNTTIPVPLVIAHSSTADNELGCEWILMEKVTGLSLKDVWNEIDLETKTRETERIAGLVRQLRDLRGRFTAIGNIYFREDINSFNGEVRSLPITDGEEYALGPIVTPYMFVGGRKLRASRDLGPYSDDDKYIAALITSELEDMELLQSPDARSYSDFDEDLAEDAEEITKLLNELQKVSSNLFSSLPRTFSLLHHDLSLDNIIVHPETHEIVGIVDWECVGTRPHWEAPYPLFLDGPNIEEEVEPLSPGDTDDFRVERWENWEKMKLRLVFDRELGQVRDLDDGEDEARREFRNQLDWVKISQRMVREWAERYNQRQSSESA